MLSAEPKWLKLVDRPLTPLQLRALEAVATGRFRLSWVPINGRQHVQCVRSYGGHDITGPIRALKKRHFVTGNGKHVALTVAGAMRLYLDPSSFACTRS